MPCGLNGMYWTKCNQSNYHTNLTTLCSHFLLSCGNQAIIKSAHWWLWSCYLHGWSGRSFPLKNTPKDHKSSFFPYKQVSGRNGDHEWFRMTNAFILCDLLWKVQKVHARNREGSFKNNGIERLLKPYNYLAPTHICNMSYEE